MMTKGTLSPSPVPPNRGPSEPPGTLTDRHLLERFVRHCDEAAFETLVERYGPMVLGVCRRVLGDAAEADDAFQATFLVLVRKARTLATPELIGNWLYGVAYRVARKARARRARRAEQKVPTMAAISSDDPLMEAALHELQAQLDEELERLPDKYRAPLVLCYLEGLSNREAAQRLGWPIGSISHRLERGRELLRRRFQDRHPNASYLLFVALPVWTPLTIEALGVLKKLVIESGMEAARDGAATTFSPAAQSLGDQMLRAMAATRRLRVLLIALAVLLALSSVALASWSVFGTGPFRPRPTPIAPCHSPTSAANPS